MDWFDQFVKRGVLGRAKIKILTNMVDSISVVKKFVDHTYKCDDCIYGDYCEEAEVLLKRYMLIGNTINDLYYNEISKQQEY